MKLRPYQQQAIDELMAWFKKNPTGNPIMSLPTASGKSLICAEIANMAIGYGQSVLVITPSKELCEQNYEKLKMYIDDVGIVSASAGRKQYGSKCTVATIGSIYKTSHLLETTPSILVIDEAHGVSNQNKGMYRQLISELQKVLNVRVVGMTATPYNGQGIWLTDGKDSMWSEIAVDIKMTDLILEGYLSPLTTKAGSVTIDTKDVKKTGGDFNIKQLEEVSDTESLNKEIVRDAISKSHGRKAWMAFCVSVKHAEHIKCELIEQGIKAEVVTGDTPKRERESIIEDFRIGRIKCLVSVAALVTGFDVPHIDMIIWLRNTVSPILYVQGMGRAMRIAEGKTDALVLDYTTTIQRLGCVDQVTGRHKSNRKSDEAAPAKVCPDCERILATSIRVCPCGYMFPANKIELKTNSSREAVTSLDAAVWHEVDNIRYLRHKKEGKPDSLKVNYYQGLTLVCSEWSCIQHEGFAKQKAIAWLTQRAKSAKLPDMDEILQSGGEILKEPLAIHVALQNGYKRIVGYRWYDE